jgi:hypothetical protein
LAPLRFSPFSNKPDRLRDYLSKYAEDVFGDKQWDGPDTDDTPYTIIVGWRDSLVRDTMAGAEMNGIPGFAVQCSEDQSEDLTTVQGKVIAFASIASSYPVRPAHYTASAVIEFSNVDELVGLLSDFREWLLGNPLSRLHHAGSPDPQSTLADRLDQNSGRSLDPYIAECRNAEISLLGQSARATTIQHPGSRGSKP